MKDFLNDILLLQSGQVECVIILCHNQFAILLEIVVVCSFLDDITCITLRNNLNVQDEVWLFDRLKDNFRRVVQHNKEKF